MITSPTECSYALEITGECAKNFTAIISDRTSDDIENVRVISSEYKYDIEALQDLEGIVEFLQSFSNKKLTKKTLLNPLFFISTEDQIDEVLEVDEDGDTIKFVGMNGNPYIVEHIECSDDSSDSKIPMIQAFVTYMEFEIPPFEKIIQGVKDHKGH